MSNHATQNQNQFLTNLEYLSSLSSSLSTCEHVFEFSLSKLSSCCFTNRLVRYAKCQMLFSLESLHRFVFSKNTHCTYVGEANNIRCPSRDFWFERSKLNSSRANGSLCFSITISWTRTSQFHRRSTYVQCSPPALDIVLQINQSLFPAPNLLLVGFQLSSILEGRSQVNGLFKLVNH